MSGKGSDFTDRVGDSGLVETDVSASITNTNQEPTNQEAAPVSFSEITTGVLYLSDSSQSTEKASTEVDDGKWPSSVSSSSTQRDGNKLRVQLEEKSQHNKKVIKLMEDKHALELKVEKMNTNEERLKRELIDAKCEAAMLKLTLGQQELLALRSKTREALKQKDAPNSASHCRPPKYLDVVEWKNPPLGTGSYGVVRSVRVKNDDTYYAAKTFKLERPYDDELKKKCIEEHDILRHVDHENIVRYIGFCFYEDDKMPTIIMEMMDKSLSRSVEEKALSRSQKILILHDVANGLLCLHTRHQVIIHRDLTANNVLLKEVNRHIQAKIADLGNAKLISHREQYKYLTRHPGTREYSAPEVETGKYDKQCDIFSFGHLTLCTLSGRLYEELAGTRGEGKNGKLVAFTEVQRRFVYFEHLSHETTLLETLKTKECLEFLPSKRPQADELKAILDIERRKVDDCQPREVHQPCLEPQSNPSTSSDSTPSTSSDSTSNGNFL